jgi:hypothetical protein
MPGTESPKDAKAVLAVASEWEPLVGEYLGLTVARALVLRRLRVFLLLPALLLQGFNIFFLNLTDVLVVATYVVIGLVLFATGLSALLLWYASTRLAERLTESGLIFSGRPNLRSTLTFKGWCVDQHILLADALAAGRRASAH